jgi:hypothetical protein
MNRRQYSIPRRYRPRAHLDVCAATNKVRFPDHRAAVVALQQAAVRRQWQGDDESRRRECRSYHCNACKGWHLTSWEEAVLTDAPIAASV